MFDGLVVTGATQENPIKYFLYLYFSKLYFFAKKKSEKNSIYAIVKAYKSDSI